MKYMLIMRADDAAVKAAESIPMEEMINRMGAFNEEMIDAGVLLAGDGLSDPAEGFVVDFTGEQPVVTDGPYGPARELFNGFWILEVPSRDDAIRWATRCPLSGGAQLEVRRITDESDFEAFADNEFIQKEEGWREQRGRR